MTKGPSLDSVIMSLKPNGSRVKQGTYVAVPSAVIAAVATFFIQASLGNDGVDKARMEADAMRLSAIEQKFERHDGEMNQIVKRIEEKFDEKFATLKEQNQRIEEKLDRALRHTQ